MNATPVILLPNPIVWRRLPVLVIAKLFGIDWNSTTSDSVRSSVSCRSDSVGISYWHTAGAIIEKRLLLQLAGTTVSGWYLCSSSWHLCTSYPITGIFS